MQINITLTSTIKKNRIRKRYNIISFLKNTYVIRNEYLMHIFVKNNNRTVFFIFENEIFFKEMQEKIMRQFPFEQQLYNNVKTVKLFT